MTTSSADWTSFAALSITHNPDYDVLSVSLACFVVNKIYKIYIILEIFQIWKNLHKILSFNMMIKFLPFAHHTPTEWIFDFIYLGTNFFLPHNIEKLSNFHAHVYYNMLVAITTDRIKIAQYWCKGVVFPHIPKSNNSKKGPVIAEQLDWKEQQVLL